MSCGCGKKAAPESERRRQAVRRLAVAHAQKTGGVVVFYRCSDYDFTEIENFDKEGKRDVEYLI
jgi:hypothetical protein